MQYDFEHLTFRLDSCVELLFRSAIYILCYNIYHAYVYVVCLTSDIEHSRCPRRSQIIRHVNHEFKLMINMMSWAGA